MKKSDKPEEIEEIIEKKKTTKKSNNVQNVSELRNMYYDGDDPRFEVVERAVLTNTYRFGENLAKVLDMFIYKTGFHGVDNNTEVIVIDAPRTATEIELRENHSEATAIKEYLKGNKEEVEKALLKRMDNVNLNELLEWDKEKRQIGTLMDGYRAERRKASDKIADLKKARENTDNIVKEMKELGTKIDKGMIKYNELDKKIFDYLALLPNTPDEDVPAGGKENNEVLRTNLEQPKFDFKLKPHYEILKDLNMVDYERGIKIAGEKNWVYTGIGARLEWALINYFIDTHIKNGFQFMMLPYMLKYECGFGAGQFPKFNDEVYMIKTEDEDEKNTK